VSCHSPIYLAVAFTTTGWVRFEKKRDGCPVIPCVIPAVIPAYFTIKSPSRGVQQFSSQWKGVTWQFASQQHLEQFESDQEHYAPRFGGYCSLTTAHGASIPSNPRAWSIHEERLYLFVFESARDTWLLNPDQLILRAKTKWLATNSQDEVVQISSVPK